jgi:hypothetical protein
MESRSLFPSSQKVTNNSHTEQINPGSLIFLWDYSEESKLETSRKSQKISLLD